MFKKKHIVITILLFCTTSQAWVSIDTLHKESGINKATIAQAITTITHQEKEAESSWNSYYHIFPNLIKKFNLKKGCEIGVSTGGHSYSILSTTHVEKLYSIDPYCLNASLNLWVNNNDYYTIMYLRVKHRLARFGQRSEMIRAYSQDVYSRFKDGELDFVFVDGSHEYNDVMSDLINYYPKIRSGGIIAGDDYCTNHPGVPRAVNEFFKKLGVTVIIDQEQPRIWWIQKP